VSQATMNTQFTNEKSMQTISLANSVVGLHRKQLKNAVDEFPVTT